MIPKQMLLGMLNSFWLEQVIINRMPKISFSDPNLDRSAKNWDLFHLESAGDDFTGKMSPHDTEPHGLTWEQGRGLLAESLQGRPGR